MDPNFAADSVVGQKTGPFWLFLAKERTRVRCLLQKSAVVGGRNNNGQIERTKTKPPLLIFRKLQKHGNVAPPSGTSSSEDEKTAVYQT